MGEKKIDTQVPLAFRAVYDGIAANSTLLMHVNFARIPGSAQERFWEVAKGITSVLRSVANDPQNDRIEVWTGQLIAAAENSLIGAQNPWGRRGGFVSARKKLSTIARLVEELNRQIEGLPKEAIDALCEVGGAHDEASTAIVRRKLWRSMEQEFELMDDLSSLSVVLPISEIVEARLHDQLVRYARRIPGPKELRSMLPRFAMAVARAELLLAKSRKPVGRPRDERKQYLTKLAQQAYEELSGLSANVTTNQRKNADGREVTTFPAFADDLYYWLGFAPPKKQGKGGVSQTKKLRKRRNISIKGR